jgi:hypothetical protein
MIVIRVVWPVGENMHIQASRHTYGAGGGYLRRSALSASIDLIKADHRNEDSRTYAHSYGGIVA